ncbi:MAG: RluA family pseudouridine synthase [Pseudomonadota bacterium]
MNSGVRLYEVPKNRDGQRLDNLLVAELKGVPKSLVYRIIRKGQVRVNGSRAKAMQRVSAGDVVRIPPVRTDAPREKPRFPEDLVKKIEAAVAFENDRYLVLDKPAGLAVHAGSGLSWGLIDVVRQLREGFIELAHRLDRETSGCLVFARDREALLGAQSAFRDPTAEKRYLALLQGSLSDEPRFVDAPLRRNVERGGERMVMVDPNGKPARSRFQPIERFSGWTLTEVRIQTGRTHQIRVHAAHLGHPVAGDERYGSDRKPPGLTRLFLHCSMVNLPLEGLGEDLTASAPLPPELHTVLEALAARRRR